MEHPLDHPVAVAAIEQIAQKRQALRMLGVARHREIVREQAASCYPILVDHRGSDTFTDSAPMSGKIGIA